MRMMMVLIMTGLCFYLPSLKAAETHKVGFSSAEHRAQGDDVKLTLPQTDSLQGKPLLELPNGLKLSYGTILAFGDFYGVVNQSISRDKQATAQQALFLKAFNSLARSAHAVSEAPKILEIFKLERALADKALLDENPEQAMIKAFGGALQQRYSCATGGGCGDRTWWLYPGRYLSLAMDNIDHFGDNAMLTYQAGHQLALAEAIRGFRHDDPKSLVMAYALNAFASHFLSDRFASGHIRTPRSRIVQAVTFSPLTAALLTLYMHDEDNFYGFHVHNLRGDHWVAYGDKAYFLPKSLQHNTILNEALQASADAILFAYEHGYAPDESVLESLLPIPDESAPKVSQDIAPMFYWDDEKQLLMRRVNLNDPFSAQWTANWLSWPTLNELSKRKELKSAGLVNCIKGLYNEKPTNNKEL